MPKGIHFNFVIFYCQLFLTSLNRSKNKKTKQKKKQLGYPCYVFFTLLPRTTAWYHLGSVAKKGATTYPCISRLQTRLTYSIKKPQKNVVKTPTWQSPFQDK